MMAESVEQQHKRREICANRPLYRDGRRDTAVKVFTINQESRYLLVQGVPDIKITDELLKLFSLYGTILEYRILDDYPSEEFTKTYWIKYGDIQAARVAKRKMDDHSFYGGFLHVCYAPEYESLQDTREKLQQRRMAIARRLRKLAQERAAETTEDEGLEVIPVTSETSTPAHGSHIRGPSTAWESSSNVTTASIRSESRSTGPDRWQQNENRPISQHEPAQLHPALPNPPRHLPPWQWDIPSVPDFPRLRTAHDTLPAGFNPFPDRSDQPSEGPFIGPQMPSRQKQDQDTDFCGQLHSHRTSNPAQRTNFNQLGARPKYSHDISGAQQSTSLTPLEQSEVRQNVSRHGDGQQLTCLTPSQQSEVRPDAHHHGDGQTTRDIDKQLPVTSRPKLVARRRLGPDSHSRQLQDSHLDPSNASVTTEDKTSTRTEGKPSFGFLPRVVNISTKRSASRLDAEDDDDQTNNCLYTQPDTGSASFDRTVTDVRHRLSQVSESRQTGSASSTSSLQNIINQVRQRGRPAQRRPAQAPGRPPTKRQRI